MIIDRIENGCAVIETNTREMINISLSCLPVGCREGMKLKGTLEGYVISDAAEDRKRIQEKMNRLMRR